ncbi:MAG: metal-dependent hydrolase [Deltaproteobacteria bacterium]|nr:metal-dependent hydrolase [Deltaproteobacteria bacterium]
MNDTLTFAESPPAVRAKVRGRLPVIRKPGLSFGPEIPRWWLHNNPVLTHAANGLHLVFPEGERFFIRSVKHYLEQLDDPQLVARCRAFFGQEARHGQEHEKSFEMLRGQGYHVDRFLEFYEQRALPTIEAAISPALRLSVTVALEHLTATLGEAALSDDFLDGAHPELERLLRWHACEEIEHKSVAFDVYQEVDGRYTVRIAGMVLGMTALMAFWTLASRMLLAEERATTKDQWRGYRAQARSLRGGHIGRLFRRAFVDYLDPNFHPDQNDNLGLAESYLQRAGLSP